MTLLIWLAALKEFVELVEFIASDEIKFGVLEQASGAIDEAADEVDQEISSLA